MVYTTGVKGIGECIEMSRQLFKEDPEKRLFLYYDEETGELTGQVVDEPNAKGGNLVHKGIRLNRLLYVGEIKWPTSATMLLNMISNAQYEGGRYVEFNIDGLEECVEMSKQLPTYPGNRIKRIFVYFNTDTNQIKGEFIDNPASVGGNMVDDFICNNRWLYIGELNYPINKQTIIYMVIDALYGWEEDCCEGWC